MQVHYIVKEDDDREPYYFTGFDETGKATWAKDTDDHFRLAVFSYHEDAGKAMALIGPSYYITTHFIDLA